MDGYTAFENIRQISNVPVMVVRLGYELSRLDQTNTDLQRENDALTVELATLTSSSRLAPLARVQLHMQVPSLVIPVKGP